MRTRVRRWGARAAMAVMAVMPVAAVFVALMAPTLVSDRRQSAHEDVRERLRSLELPLGGVGVEYGDCLVGLGEPHPMPPEWQGVQRDEAAEWACPAAARVQWPLYEPPVPVEECDDSSVARWHPAGWDSPLARFDRPTLGRIELALLEPDPERRLEAARAALVASAALARVLGRDGFSSALLVARSLELAPLATRRALAAELRRLAAEVADARFLLAADRELDPLIWREVTWADFPWTDQSELRSLITQPFGVLGPEPEPSDPALLYQMYATDHPPDLPIRAAVDYRLAALLLEKEDRREVVAGHDLESFMHDGRRCVRDSEWSSSEPVCFLPEEVVARDIAVARLAQSFAHELARPQLEHDYPEARVADLPAGELRAPTRVDSRFVPAERRTATDSSPRGAELHLRAIWSERGEEHRCYLVLESHGTFVMEASTSREHGGSVPEPRERWEEWDRQVYE